ncbi:MAG: GTPase domain-containing protein [Candidatus Lokiarchaeota archaeon]|nr:GTPase domain-containing protein [Candidatus Lokiarchaeota archaeon]
MPKEVILALSYFDTTLGPTNLYCSSPLNPQEHPDLGRILEFTEEEGNFIFTFRKYQTINHIFYIDSEFARGGKELLMITYMIRAAYFKDEITDVYNYLLSKTPDLESYASELKKLNELTGILHSHKNRVNKKETLSVASKKFKKEFFKLFNKYLEKMSPQLDLSVHLLDKGNLKKIYIFGPRNAGKTELVKNLEVIQFLQYKNNNMKRDLSSKIYDFIIDNIEVLTYECIDEDMDGKKTKLYEDCIDNAQGFILIFNASNKDSLKETIEMFQLVLNKCQDKGDTMPILIIGNKFDDEEEITSDMIYEKFDMEELKECGLSIEYFSINVLSENDEIINAIRWLLKQMI